VEAVTSLRAVLPAIVLICAAGCGKSTTAPTTSPAPSTAALTATFDDNPVSYKTAGCSFSTPQGWYTNVKVQETNGIAVTVTSLTQKLDGGPAVGILDESFNSRFGACSGDSFQSSMIPARGSVCAVVGVCTTGTYGTYQFTIAGSDANGHSITFDSPVLRFSAK